MGYNSVDLDLLEGRGWPADEEDEDLDYGGVPVRDEGDGE